MCRDKFNICTLSDDAYETIKSARWTSRLPMQSVGSFDIMNNVYEKERFNLPLDTALIDAADQEEIDDYGRLAKVMNLYQFENEELMKSDFFEQTTTE